MGAALPTEYDRKYLTYTFKSFPTDGIYSWDLETVLNARDGHMLGQFDRSAPLAQAMKADPAIFCAILNYLAPALSLPREMLGASGTGHEYRSGGLAERIRKEAETTFGPAGEAITPVTEAELFEGRGVMGLFVGQNLWTPSEDGSRINVRLEPFPLRYVRWNSWKKTLEAQTVDGIIPITHGDGKWVVDSIRDIDPWKSAALIPLAGLWPDRQFARRDRALNAESHGEVKWIGTLPPDVGPETEQGQKYMADIRKLYRARSGLVKAHGTELEREEAMSQAWQIFREIMNSDRSEIFQILLGQDGTANNSGGNYIKAEVLFGVRNDIVETALKGGARTLTSGTLRPWTALNFGAVDLTPYRCWQMPDPDEEFRRESLAKRHTAFTTAILGFRTSGFKVDRTFSDYLAKLYGVIAPELDRTLPPLDTPPPAQKPPQDAPATDPTTETP